MMVLCSNNHIVAVLVVLYYQLIQTGGISDHNFLMNLKLLWNKKIENLLNYDKLNGALKAKLWTKQELNLEILEFLKYLMIQNEEDMINQIFSTKDKFSKIEKLIEILLEIMKIDYTGTVIEI